MTDEDELERLGGEYLKADNEYTDLAYRLDMELEAAIRAASAKLRAKRDAKYDAELNRLHVARLAAKATYEAAKLAAAKDSLPFPVGTKLIGWMRSHISTYRRGPLKKKSTGIVEVCDNDTVIPKGIRYGRPHIGDVLVRLLKKNGKPGKAIEKYNGDGWRTHIWLPDGEKPKDS